MSESSSLPPTEQPAPNGLPPDGTVGSLSMGEAPGGVAPAAPAPADQLGGSASTPADPPEWAVDRIDTLTRRLREAEEQRERDRLAYETRLAEVAQGKPGLSETEVEQRAMQLASARTFQEQVTRTHSAGQAEFTDFDATMQNFVRLGGAPPALIHAVLAQGEDAHRVMYALGKDLSAASRILQLDPIRMAAEVTKYGLTVKSKAAAPAAPAAPPPPSAPPVAPVVSAPRGSNAGAVRLDDTNVPIDTWMAARKKSLEDRRRRA